MATMVAEVYDALIEAGASEDKARRAATVLADYDQQFGGIKIELGDVRSDLKVLRAMNAVTISMCAAILLRLFIH